MIFAIGQIPGIKLVTGNAVFTSTRQALGSLFGGIAVFAVLLLLGLLILISLLFSAIVQERYHELGLLRALGARPDQIMRIILTEAAAITVLGGLSWASGSASSWCFSSPARSASTSNRSASRSRGPRRGSPRWRRHSRCCSP